MLKGNPDWLRQMSDDLILHSDSHDIVKNLELAETLLKEKHTQLYLSPQTL